MEDIERRRERQRRYREVNRDKIRAYNREYRERNATKRREYDREYKAKNRDKILTQRYEAQNRERKREYDREYYIRNREKLREQNREYRARNREFIRALGMRYRHGLQPEAWAAMWETQCGCCYLCGDELIPDETHVDHDYRCCPRKRSCQLCCRGLACNNCNVAVGMAGDDPARLRAIADALERAQAGVTERLATKPIQDELGA